MFIKWTRKPRDTRIIVWATKNGSHFHGSEYSFQSVDNSDGATQAPVDGRGYAFGVIAYHSFSRGIQRPNDNLSRRGRRRCLALFYMHVPGSLEYDLLVLPHSFTETQARPRVEFDTSCRRSTRHARGKAGVIHSEEYRTPYMLGAL